MVKEAIGGTGQGMEFRLTNLVWLARNSQMGYPKDYWPQYSGPGEQETQFAEGGGGPEEAVWEKGLLDPTLFGVCFTQSN